VEIAVANHLAALKRDHADDLAGLDPPHPAVDRLIVVHVYHQVVIILAGKRSNEAFEELLILCAQGPENHGHGCLQAFFRISITLFASASQSTAA
jgi:hypothetical protein